MFLKRAEEFLNSIGIYDILDHECEYDKDTKHVQLSFLIHMESDIFGEDKTLCEFIKEHSHGNTLDELLWEIPHNVVLECDFTCRGLTIKPNKGKYELVYSFLRPRIEEKLIEIYGEEVRK